MVLRESPTRDGRSYRNVESRGGEPHAFDEETLFGIAGIDSEKDLFDEDVDRANAPIQNVNGLLRFINQNPSGGLDRNSRGLWEVRHGAEGIATLLRIADERRRKSCGAPRLPYDAAIEDYARYALRGSSGHGHQGANAVHFDALLSHSAPEEQAAWRALANDDSSNPADDERIFIKEGLSGSSAFSPNMLAIGLTHSVYGLRKIIEEPALLVTAGIPMTYTGCNWKGIDELLPTIREHRAHVVTILGHGFGEPAPRQTVVKDIHRLRRASWGDVRQVLAAPTRGIFAERDHGVEHVRVRNIEIARWFGDPVITEHLRVALFLNCYSVEIAERVVQIQGDVEAAIGYKGKLPVYLARDFHQAFCIFYSMYAHGRGDDPSRRDGTIEFAFYSTLASLHARYSELTLNREASETMLDLINNFVLIRQEE